MRERLLITINLPVVHRGGRRRSRKSARRGVGARLSYRVQLDPLCTHRSLALRQPPPARPPTHPLAQAPRALCRKACKRASGTGGRASGRAGGRASKWADGRTIDARVNYNYLRSWTQPGGRRPAAEDRGCAFDPQNLSVRRQAVFKISRRRAARVGWASEGGLADG